MAPTLVLACLALAQQPAAAPPTDVFAMTRSGVQVEVSERPARGALDLVTPFGVYHTPTDPVETVLERVRDRKWRGQLRTTPAASLVPIIETYADNGQISALLELTEAVLQRGRSHELRAALTALEAWGARFDPVELGLSPDERVEGLWEEVQKTEGLRRLLLGARLAAEVAPGRNGEGDRQLTLTTLSRAFEDSDPLMQRVVLLVTRRQLMDEPYFGARVQHASLYASAAVRDLAGATAVRLRPTAAREYWVKALLRAEDALRLHAAEQLAQHLPDYAPKPFVLLIAIEDRRAPSKFSFLDHAVQVVVDRDEPLALRQLQFAFSRGGNERNEYLENASTIKAVRLEDELQSLLKHLLQGLAGDDVERTPAQWMEWYEKRQVKP